MTSEHAGARLKLEHKREAENRNGGKGRGGKSRGEGVVRQISSSLPTRLPLPLPHLARVLTTGEEDPAEGREGFSGSPEKKKGFVEMRCRRRRDFLWGRAATRAQSFIAGRTHDVILL